MLLDTLACSLLIRGWLSTLSEAWIRGLPSDSDKLVGKEGRQNVECSRGNFWCVSQRVWHGLLLLTFPALICDRSPGAGVGRQGAWKVGKVIGDLGCEEFPNSADLMELPQALLQFMRMRSTKLRSVCSPDVFKDYYSGIFSLFDNDRKDMWQRS